MSLHVFAWVSKFEESEARTAFLFGRHLVQEMLGIGFNVDT